MKKALKTIAIIYLTLIIIVGSLAIWQWDNVKSVYIGLKESHEQIEDRRVKNQTALVDDINKFLDEPVRELTEEEKKKIESGSAALSEVYAKIFEEREALSKSAQVGKTPEPDKKSKLAENKKKDEIISKYMAQIYSLQGEFTARAEATIKQGARYYESIKAHPQDPVARAKTITHFTPVVRGLEAECDGRFNKIVAKLQKELEVAKIDTDIVGTIKETYKNEKQLKLSYYSNKYLK
ncbi:MAG: hypothetical protein IJX50_02700 [Clostridia bacterium]|nr:hypothetical protein [Clostridia bacterium]